MIFHIMDDISILVSVRTKIECLYKYNILNVTLINSELRKVSVWLKLNKLSLNFSKTRSMVFHQPHRNVSIPDIKI